MLNLDLLYDDFFDAIHTGSLATHVNVLHKKLTSTLLERPHGDMARWFSALQNLPDIAVSNILLNQDVVQFKTIQQPDTAKKEQLQTSLLSLRPWRHGPFNFFDIFVETEWNSFMKWQRLIPHIKSLCGKTVLDIGCGSGYFIWRMLGEGASQVIGLDPSQLLLMQFESAKRYAGRVPAHVLPLRMEEFPEDIHYFDTIFSMGVLYHQKEPVKHLQQIKNAMHSSGELVLETLVLDASGEDTVLKPENRHYAGMSNVYSIPSLDALIKWMKLAGFTSIKVESLAKTTIDEQRKTRWIQTYSLENFLNADRSLTVEGYQTPTRATLIAAIDSTSD